MQCHLGFTNMLTLHETFKVSSTPLCFVNTLFYDHLPFKKKTVTHTFLCSNRIFEGEWDRCEGYVDSEVISVGWIEEVTVKIQFLMFEECLLKGVSQMIGSNMVDIPEERV
eukprot:TRINITY_DN4683_c0_g1_i12.p1 TRINITY_DN4683_c0_g1~~TRINITY_DN4683_c0_g1_i12.p1  ORF type:complete len:111 (-),score=11.74 TRINITY_DN4683_c0_g1_i12:843-1175(-)